MKIEVIGAGAWGTALALAAAAHPARHQVRLWTRSAGQAERMRQSRENAQYLPGVALPQALQVEGGGFADGADASPLARALAAAGADLVVIATPLSALRGVLRTLAVALHGAAVPVAWACKGFEAPLAPAVDAANADAVAAGACGLMPHEVQRQVAPALLAGALSGPSFAQEVARGLPAALVAASAHACVRQALVEAFHNGRSLRVYAGGDLAGVEVGGAVKNVLAIAAGLADGLGLGMNARAALITRGLAEMARLGVALGARQQTFMGLSGLGDLVLTATGDLSRNRRVGLLLAQGQTLAQAVQSLGHVAEGVYSARTVWRRACHLGVPMPIAEGVVAVLDGRASPAQAIGDLMARAPAGEA